MQKVAILTAIISIFFNTSVIVSCGGGGGDDNTSESDVSLSVDFEANPGGTCVASSFTMALKYYEPSVTFNDVYAIFGLPPFDNNEFVF